MSKNLNSCFFILLAVICLFIFSQLTFPLTVVPLTGQTFALGLISTVSGKTKTFYAVCLYLFLGTIGVPIFADMKSGLNVLTGSTGGYLISFIFYGLITTSILEKTQYNYSWAMFANLFATFITLIIGSGWLKLWNHLNWYDAFHIGFLPFLLTGIIKALAAAIIGIALLKYLNNHGINLLKF